MGVSSCWILFFKIVVKHNMLMVQFGPSWHNACPILYMRLFLLACLLRMHVANEHRIFISSPSCLDLQPWAADLRRQVSAGPTCHLEIEIEPQVDPLMCPI